MKKIIKHYPMSDRLIVRRGYYTDNRGLQHKMEKSSEIV